jgi:hypothetical protein
MFVPFFARDWYHQGPVLSHACTRSLTQMIDVFSVLFEAPHQHSSSLDSRPLGEQDAVCIANVLDTSLFIVPQHTLHKQQNTVTSKRPMGLTRTAFSLCPWV